MERTGEKDLGIIVDHIVNMSQQCTAFAKTTNNILDCINRIGNLAK